MAVIKVGNDFYNTVTGRKITGTSTQTAHAVLMAEINRAGQVGIPTRNDTPIVAGKIAESRRTPARAAHKAAGISGGFIGHAEAPKATDGQSLSSQSADVIATYTTVHGDNAYSQWVKDHNEAIAAVDVPETPGDEIGVTVDDERLSPGGFPGETYGGERDRLAAALRKSNVDTTGMTLAQLRTEILERGIIARALTETEKKEAGEQESVKTGIPDLDTALEGLRITTGFKERELDAKIAADAAQHAYLLKRLNFEDEDASRAAGLQAARIVIEERSLNRQYGLDVGSFLMSARGPRNFGQLFNIYGGDPAKAGGLPGRILSAVGGGGPPVGATPSTAVPAGAQLGFGQAIRNLYAGGAQPTADQVMGALMGSTPEPTVPGPVGQQAGVPVPQPAFGATASDPRPGFTLDPRNVNPQQFNKLLPTEQQAAFSLFESAGFPIEDVAEIFNRALPNAQRLASARLGTSGLRF